jgi:hypothetical protein
MMGADGLNVRQSLLPQQLLLLAPLDDRGLRSRSFLQLGNVPFQAASVTLDRPLNVRLGREGDIAPRPGADEDRQERE